MTVIVYRGVKESRILEMKVVIKNTLMLIAVYVIIVQQYYTLYSFLLMGVLMVGIYVGNLVLKVYEKEYVRVI